MDVDRCRDLRPSYVDFALGSIEEHAALRVRVHLSEGCAACATEIEGLMAAFFELPLAGGSSPLPGGFTEELLAAAAKLPQERPEPAIVYPDENQLRLAWTLVALSVVAVLAVTFWATRHDADSLTLERRLQAAESQTRRVADDYRIYQQRTEATVDAAELMQNPLALAVDIVDPAEVVRGRLFANWPERSLLLAVPPPPKDEATAIVVRLRAGGNTAIVGVLQPERGGLQTYDLPEPTGGPVRLELTRIPATEPAAEGKVLLTADFPSPAPSIAPEGAEMEVP